MTGSPVHPLDEYKIKAAILLKHIRSDDAEKALSAALRFQRLPHLSGSSVPQILQQKDRIKHKHALAVIALENNYASWADLKQQLERQAKRDAIRGNVKNTPLYPRRCEGFLNAWYARYEEARAHLAETDGYLLPYQNHFFVVQRDYIETLGLDPDDPDWTRIGRDWVQPADRDAWQRLDIKLQEIERNDALRKGI